MSNDLYLQALPKNTSFCAYNNDEFIFSSFLKWLMPLFEFEAFLKEKYLGQKDNLCVHDHAVGKAAIVLMLHLDIKKIHADIASSLAISFVSEVNKARKNSITFTYEKTVPHLLCETEKILEPFSAQECDIEKMYRLLRKKANLD